MTRKQKKNNFLDRAGYTFNIGEISFHCSRKTALHLGRTCARMKATETPVMAILPCRRISRKITRVSLYSHTKKKKIYITISLYPSNSPRQIDFQKG